MTQARALASAAYLAAVAAPASADWRSIADQLHAALPVTRGRAIASAVDHGATVSSVEPGRKPVWFADWKLGKVFSLDSVTVTFADGVTVRCNLAKAPGKRPRIAAACRVAVAFYRAQTGNDSVPVFASLVAASDGAEFDAAACSALTADLRVTAIVPRAVRPAVTLEAIERMERELARRIAGLARSEAMPARIAAHFTPFCLSYDAFCASVQELRAMKDSAAMAESWRAAVAAGEAELATMRAAMPGLSESGPCSAVPCVEPVTVTEAAPPALEAASCDPVATMPNHAPAPVTVAADAPCEAVNDDSAPTPPPGAGPAASPAVRTMPAVDHIEPMAICPAVGLPCKADCGFRAGCTPRDASAILEALEAEACPVAAAEAAPLEALCSDDDAPTMRTAKAPRRPRAPRAPRTPRVGIPTVTPGVGIQGRIAPASIMIPFVPGLGRPPVAFLSAPTL